MDTNFSTVSSNDISSTKRDSMSNSIQLLRIVSAYAVVLIHVVYQCYLDFPDLADERYLFPFNILCFAVPEFVMITGWIFLNPQKDYSLAKCIKRIAIPLFSYGVPFCILESIFEHRNFEIQYLWMGIYKVLIGESWAHIWYLYMLIGLYIIMPLLRKIVEGITAQQGWLFVAVIFVFNSVFVDLKRWFNVEIAFNIPISGVFVMYLLLGYLLPQIHVKLKYMILSWGGQFACLQS